MLCSMYVCTIVFVGSASIICPVIVIVVMFAFVFVLDCPLCVIGLSNWTSSWCLMETVGVF